MLPNFVRCETPLAERGCDLLVKYEVARKVPNSEQNTPQLTGACQFNGRDSEQLGEAA